MSTLRMAAYLRTKLVEELRRGRARGLRNARCIDVFERLLYLTPRDVVVRGVGRDVRAFFNPGAVLVGNELVIFPRMIFDYYWYVSCIGIARLRIEEVLDASIPRPLEVEVLLYPEAWFEMGRGCEDPRATLVGNGVVFVMYTAVGSRNPEYCVPVPMQGYAMVDLENRRVSMRNVLKARMGSETFVLEDWKNGTVLRYGARRCMALARPSIPSFSACWSCIFDPVEGFVELESVKLILAPEPWEYKVGWSTNVVKLEKDLYLAAWHGVSRSDYGYRHGFALLDSEGNLVGVTNYLLEPRTIHEKLGDRPNTIYGCGLVLYREKLLWIGGAGDHSIVVAATDLDKVMENVRWVEKR